MIFTNWWMTGQRRLLQQPVSPAPPWTRSGSRDTNRAWKVGQCHAQEQLHMRYLNWRCSARGFSVVEQLLQLLSVSDEKPFWAKQLPVASLLSPDCYFKSSHGHKCSTVRPSNVPSWVSFLCRLLQQDGPWPTLPSAVARHAKSNGVFGSCWLAWCWKSYAHCCNGKPKIRILPSGHVWHREWAMSK